MNYKFALISGDKRNIYLAEKLTQNGHEVTLYGFDKNNIKNTHSLKEIIEKHNYIICPIPFTRDNISLNTPLSAQTITLNDFLSLLDKSKTVFSGALNTNYGDDKNIIDIYAKNSVKDASTIATVEGAIKIAIENTDTSLYGSNILIIGYGQIGSYLAKSLRNLGVNVTIVTRSDSSLKKAKEDGFSSYKNDVLDEHISKKHIIFNTAEKIQLNAKNLGLVDKETVYIELASLPFGIDYEDSVKFNIKVVYGLSLPGIVSPKTISAVIYNEILQHIEEMNIWNYLI